MQEINFALVESYDNLIGCLPFKVSESEFLFPLTTNMTKTRIINITTVSDLTTEITVLVKNHSSNEVNKTLESNLNIRKLTPLNRVLIDTRASLTIVSWHAILAELFENRKAAKETVLKTNGGPFVTKHELELRFVFPEFSAKKFSAHEIFLCTHTFHRGESQISLFPSVYFE